MSQFKRHREALRYWDVVIAVAHGVPVYAIAMHRLGHDANQFGVLMEVYVNEQRHEIKGH